MCVEDSWRNLNRSSLQLIQCHVAKSTWNISNKNSPGRTLRSIATVALKWMITRTLLCSSCCFTLFGFGSSFAFAPHYMIQECLYIICLLNKLVFSRALDRKETDQNAYSLWERLYNKEYRYQFQHCICWDLLSVFYCFFLFTPTTLQLK